jgi:hypothetical protein
MVLPLASPSAPWNGSSAVGEAVLALASLLARSNARSDAREMVRGFAKLAGALHG